MLDAVFKSIIFKMTYFLGTTLLNLEFGHFQRDHFSSEMSRSLFFNEGKNGQQPYNLTQNQSFWSLQNFSSTLCGITWNLLSLKKIFFENSKQMRWFSAFCAKKWWGHNVVISEIYSLTHVWQIKILWKQHFY